MKGIQVGKGRQKKPRPGVVIGGEKLDPPKRRGIPPPLHL